MGGYIKDWRSELDSDIWLMPPLYHRVWQWLKYQVNHQEQYIPMRDGSKVLIKKGQRLTSVRDIAKGVSWYEGGKKKEPNPKTISSILEWLEKQEMIFIDRGKGNRQYTLITLLNWDLYQRKDNEGNSSETVGGEGSKQLMDINKNEKNVKNEKNEKNNNSMQQMADPHENWFMAYEMYYGQCPTPIIAQTMDSFLEDGMEGKLLAYAIKKAAENGNRFHYAKGILNNWIKKNVFTMEQALKEEENYNQRREGKSYGKRSTGSHPIPKVKGTDPSLLDFSNRRSSL